MTAGEAASIRQLVLSQRRALPTAERIRLSHLAIDRLFGHLGATWSQKRIALYRSLPDEISLEPLESKLRSMGARTYFPRMLTADSLEMVEVGDPALAWQTGVFRFQEPPRELKAADPGELEIIIVPGVVFGEAGERIGLGKGHYDRFLPKAPKALRVALAFDFQVKATVPQSPWDQPVHLVVTDARVCGRTPHV